MTGPSAAGGRLPPLGLANLVIVYVVWSTTFLAMRIGVRPGSGVEPWVFGGTRVLAGGLLLVVAALLVRQRLRLPRRELWALWASGILIWGTGHGFLLWAEQWTDSGYTGLFIAVFPILGALYSAALDRRPPSLVLMASLVVGFAGIVVLTGPRMEGADALDPLVIAALLFAPVGWAAGWVLQRRVVREAKAFASSAHQHLAAAPVFLAMSWLSGEPTPDPTRAVVVAWSYLVVFGSVVAYSAAVYALHHLPTPVAMTYGYVTPVFTVVVGHFVLEEALSWWLLLGAALVLAGVYGVFRAPVQPGPPAGPGPAPQRPVPDRP